MQFRNSLIPVTAVLALAACNAQPTEEPVPPDTGTGDTATSDTGTSETPSPAPTETVSILRPDIVPPVIDESEAMLEPLEVVIGFPAGGSALDETAVAELQRVLASPQLAAGGLVTLSAHSDSDGSDAVNLAASERRGNAVKQWLVDEGVEGDRVTIIAFGEQNPIEPNALPDGSSNEPGRAANRRVKVEVLTVARKDGEPEEPSETPSPAARD